MPKLYEYLGIAVFFYSNEHEPVHGRYQGRESKIEIVLKNGQVSNLNTLPVSRKKPLPPPQLKDFEKLVATLADEIVANWVNYFVYNKKIVTKRIQGKIS